MLQGTMRVLKKNPTNKTKQKNPTQIFMVLNLLNIQAPRKSGKWTPAQTESED